MSRDTLIDNVEIAKLGGVAHSYLVIGIAQLPDFPGSVAKRLNTKLYSRKATLIWLKTHDMAACLREIARKRYRSMNETESMLVVAKLDNQAAQQFLRGDFAGPSERHRIEMKKLVARHYGGGQRQRITVRPDWMTE
jgi:hypothetical protein